jgi:hypothetical protein
MSNCEYIYTNGFYIFNFEICFLKRKFYFLDRPRVIINQFKNEDWQQIYPKDLL